MLPVEWPTDKTLQFIEEYKVRPVLWDREHVHYRIADRKMKAWSEMAAIFNTETWELKKKMNSLLASYRRERCKNKMRNAVGELFVSTWFAYKGFSFLSDKHTPSYTPKDDHDDTVDTDATEISQVDLIKAEATDINSLYFNEEDLTVLNGIEQQEEERHPPRKRRKIPDDEPRYRAETSTVPPEVHRRDDCDIFGEYISGKMRYFDHKTKCVVQYLMSNVLFQADMGRFRDGDFDYESFIASIALKNKNVQVNNDTDINH